MNVYATPACRGCLLKADCTTGPERRIRRWQHDAVIDSMQERLSKTPEQMQLRRQTLEHPFGTLKSWMGATHFLTKTLAGVSTETSLHVLALNLRGSSASWAISVDDDTGQGLTGLRQQHAACLSIERSESTTDSCYRRIHLLMPFLNGLDMKPSVQRTSRRAAVQRKAVITWMKDVKTLEVPPLLRQPATSCPTEVWQSA